MLAVHHFAGFAPAMLKRLMRTLLAALAVVLMLAFASGTSWAQRVIDAPTIQAPPGSTMLPPPDDPDPQPSYYDAATGVSISAPSTMAPGSTAYVTVTIRNSGTTTWYPGVANPYRLGSQNPQDNTTWGVGRVELGSTVAPGGNAVFGFTITAPSTPGTYAFGWAMLREGMYWFGGNISSSITVAVPPPVYDAQLISASVPSSMTAGSYYNVSMTLKNTGNTTWTSPDFSLANTDDNYTFGPNRVAMSPSTVAPGQSSTFNFQVRAPATAGSYTFQWGMVWEYHQRFGQNSTTYITVSAPAPVTPRPTISVSRPSLTAGQSFTTSWSITDATSLTHVCTSSGTGYTVNESLAVNGSRALTAQSAWVGYPSSCTWTASGAGGSANYTETMTTVAAAADGSVTYVHTDGLGSPIAKTDSNGTVISRTRYEPYGYVASGDQPTIGFTGHVNDVDTGLTYMQQRYYDPVAGRFLSIDPVITDVKTGGSFNRYAYANNNPYRYIDPDGREGQVTIGSSILVGFQVPGVFGGQGGFLGGGLSVGITSHAQIIVQGNYTLSQGVGAIASVGAQVSVSGTHDPTPVGVSTSKTIQFDANAGLGEVAGGSIQVPLPKTGQETDILAGKGVGGPKVGVGAGAQVSAGKNTTVTVASPPLMKVPEIIKKVFGD